MRFPLRGAEAGPSSSRREWACDEARFVLGGSNHRSTSSPVGCYRFLAPRCRFVVEGVEHESRHKKGGPSG